MKVRTGKRKRKKKTFRNNKKIYIDQRKVILTFHKNVSPKNYNEVARRKLIKKKEDEERFLQKTNGLDVIMKNNERSKNFH